MDARRILPGLAVFLLAAGTALACGDKLSAMGGGIRFERVHAARHPGRVLLYMPGESPLRRSSDQLKLADLLRRSGHQVEIGENRDVLQQELAGGGDRALLVVMDVADAQQLASTLPAAAPLLLVTAGKVSSAAASCALPVSRRGIPKLLNAVDEALSPQAPASACSIGQARTAG